MPRVAAAQQACHPVCSLHPSPTFHLQAPPHSLPTSLAPPRRPAPGANTPQAPQQTRRRRRLRRLAQTGCPWGMAAQVGGRTGKVGGLGVSARWHLCLAVCRSLPACAAAGGVRPTAAPHVWPLRPPTCLQLAAGRRGRRRARRPRFQRRVRAGVGTQRERNARGGWGDRHGSLHSGGSSGGYGVLAAPAPSATPSRFSCYSFIGRPVQRTPSCSRSAAPCSCS